MEIRYRINITTTTTTIHKINETFVSKFFFLSFSIMLLLLPHRSGQSSPPMYTEVLPGDQSLALMITSLTEGMAGMYYCSASYANNVPLEISVKIETYGKLSLYSLCKVVACKRILCASTIYALYIHRMVFEVFNDNFIQKLVSKHPR